MKPKWNDSPLWANWLAMDENGKWYWYEQKPWPCEDFWQTTSMYRNTYCISENTDNWKQSLEERPNEP